MFQFKNKIIFLISPERWGAMKVSKHHYAIELAKNNCAIYFLEPPYLSNKGIQIEVSTENPQIKIVKYHPLFRGKRFLPAFLYHLLVRSQIKLLIKKIGVQPDVVWSFHGYLFENLKWFGAKLNIFFAADQFLYDSLPPEISSADISFAVSDTIYERIKKSSEAVYQINHGLQECFVKNAEHLLQNGTINSNHKKIVAGYTGNLRMEALDRKTMMQVIEQNPDVRFIFWGSYKKNELNLGGINNNEADAFILFLEQQSNVELRGVVSSEELCKQMNDANLFWLCWKIGVNKLWDGSNSHKILEYLSTGCPVVSHYVSSYRNENLLYMLGSKNNDGYINLFNKTVQLVTSGNDTEALKKNRLKKAMDCSYTSNLLKIEQLINNKSY